MDKKNITIMVMGYIGILFMVIGFLITPSQGDMKEAEMKFESFRQNNLWNYDLNNENYETVKSDYDNIKRQENLAEHFVPIGLGMVLLTIPYAILATKRQEFKPPPPPTIEQYPYPHPRVRKPEDFLANPGRDVEERR